MEITENKLTDLMQFKEKMEVMELEYRYVRSVDSRDWQTTVDLFHSAGQLYLVVDGKQDLVGGKSEIEKFFREIANRDFIFGRHSISNPIVAFEGDTASFSSYYHTTFIHDTFTKVNFGYYDDKVEKEEGVWKLMEKQIVVGWSDLLVPLKQLKQDK
ncbi:nuclear transport factor 2 family protein [Thermodesulfobacteriota bacterium]